MQTSISLINLINLVVLLDKKFMNATSVAKKTEGSILVKSLSPGFLETARKEQDSKASLFFFPKAN